MPLAAAPGKFGQLQRAEAAANLFERQTCTICHEISRQDDDIPWKIEPVRLTEVIELSLSWVQKLATNRDIEILYRP